MTNSTNNDLGKLAQERDNILLAEVAGLLHDVGKFCDAFMQKQAGVINSFDYKTIISSHGNTTRQKISDFLNTSFKLSLNKTCNILGSSHSIADLIIQGKPSYAAGTNRINLPDKGWLIALLGVCHGEAHYDKQDAKKNQSLPFLTSSSFGYEKQTFWIGDSNPQKGLTAYLQIMQPIPNLTSDIPSFMSNIRKQFQRGLGDTRQPTNEVTLDDWSFSVATLFKTAIATALLNNRCTDIRQYTQRPQIDHDIKWRLLRISYDGLAFLERAPTMGDMLGRQSALTDALDKVRKLLEYTYPFGNEVYRDENGSAFVVPALDGDDNNGNKLHGLIDCLIYDAFRNSNLHGEVKPRICISETSKEAKELHTLLREQPPEPNPFPDAIQCWWQGESADICTACGVRPQGWGAPNNKKKQKAEDRNVCYVCLERRENRSEVWATGRTAGARDEERELWQHTIWVDEVADKNGRLALIVGHFNLDEWLSGTMIQTMLVVCDQANSTYVSKNPSFARIQRVWRTTQQFWQDVWDEDIVHAGSSTNGSQTKKHARLEISVSNADEQNLGYYHAYDTTIAGLELSVVWDSAKRCFITADNLNRWVSAEALKKQLEQMQKDGKQLSLSEAGGYGKQRRTMQSVDITGVKLLLAAYTPAVKLLAEPRSFMALVPANKAVEVANAIRQRYEREISKVRNRLPMHLGVVFFGRRQPLFSVLDAGRRMLDIQLSPENCLVESNIGYCDLAPEPPQLHFKQQYNICLKTQQEEILTWRVSTVMGDGQTEDKWYPYVAVDSDANGNAVVGRKQFLHNNQQWVHATELQVGDTVHFTPARFSYLFLDTSARRFEVGKRESLLPLEELERMQAMWKKLCAIPDMSESRLHAVVTLLTMKRDEWGEKSESYTQLIKTVFANEQLGHLLTDNAEQNKQIAQRLLRTFELYQQILKKRLKKDCEED